MNSLSAEEIHKEAKKQPISFIDPSARLISKHEPQDPSVGSTTYWYGNSQSRILVYSFCEGSPFSIIIKMLQTLKYKVDYQIIALANQFNWDMQNIKHNNTRIREGR